MKQNNFNKKMTKRVQFFCALFVILPFTIIFTSCNVNLTIKVNTDKTALVSYDSKMDDAFLKLLKSIFTLSEGDENSQTPLFDTTQIKTFLLQQGMQNTTCTTDTNANLSFSSTLNLENGIKSCPNLITFENTTKKLALNMTPENLALFIESLPEDLRNIPDLLMAPIFTGENLEKDEYKQILSSFYGKNICDELENSNLNITLVMANGKNQSYKVNILDFLTNTDKKVFEIKQ